MKAIRFVPDSARGQRLAPVFIRTTKDTDYPTRMDLFGHTDEREFLEAAEFSATELQNLRLAVDPVIRREVVRYVQRWDVPRKLQADLLLAGEEAVPHALKTYLTNRRQEHT